MKSLVSLLILSTIVTSPLVAMAESVENATAERAFLWDNRQRVQLILGINAERIQFTVDCLSKMTDDEFANVAPENADHPQPWKSCPDTIAQIRRNTQLRYPLMRRTLLLSQLLTNASLDQMLRTLEGDVYTNFPSQAIHLESSTTWSNMFARSTMMIENPLSAWLSAEELPTSPWTKEEILDVIQETQDPVRKDANFNAIFKKGCNYLNQDPHIDFSFCKSIDMEYSEQDNGIFLKFNAGTTPPGWFHTGTSQNVDIFRDFAPGAFRRDQSLYEQQYKVIVQENPYVGLVSSANPSREDFLNAFVIMSKRAQTSIENFDKLRVKYNLDNYEQADRSELIDLMHYTPIVHFVADNPGPKLTEVLRLMPLIDAHDVMDNLMSQYRTQGWEQDGKQLLLVLGANMVCWIPVSRVFGTAGKWALRLVRAEHIGQPP